MKQVQTECKTQVHKSFEEKGGSAPCDILSPKLIITQTLHDSTVTDRLQKTDDRVFI